MIDASTSPSAVVVARSAEDRILLRALLRLHRVPVEGEADGAAQALALLRAKELTHMVLDSELADGDAASLVTEAQSLHPTMRVILLSHPGVHPPLPTAFDPALVVQLSRPFRLSQFTDALGLLEPPGSRGAPTSSRPFDRPDGRG